VLVIGLLGTGFFGAGTRSVQEREQNLLRRLKVAPIPPLPPETLPPEQGRRLLFGAVRRFLANVALHRRLLCIRDAYDDVELAGHARALRFARAADVRAGPTAGDRPAGKQTGDRPVDVRGCDLGHRPGAAPQGELCQSPFVRAQAERRRPSCASPGRDELSL